ncbi:monosaccharide ABC transporter membrane protein (CUT2 family) [Roseiarcus fermentans]|uniref:Monosaccharide ABC transporter membrane protein (CUT2 family) n=1 Tax=Roseiarcus fermentans TaxID=1473586 RepID=A0A366FUC8_9HYPH|nr:SMP-30/gluconolactonase/LRE family protein [Roseiarcus fermentans]RBP18197.1 monosaccharide ABC transporter membrane protein (CUT2 family) [Roseiarcus fermentans]
MTSDAFIRLRYRLVPDRIVGEILSKSWIDSAIPALALVLVVVSMQIAIPGYFSAGSLSDLSRQVAEFGLVAIAMTIVMLSGGIDLSVGSMFALCVLAALTSMNVLGLPIGVAAAATAATGLACGALNGALVGYLRLRAFITTLVTLVIFRALYDIVFPRLASGIVGSSPQSPLWDTIGFGDVVGVPVSFVIFAVLAIVIHIGLSRLKPGWRLRAVGGARRSAYNAGINVKLTVFFAYVASGLLVATAAFLFSARLGSTGADTGIGLEIAILTAVLLGGVTLGGGRGSVGNAIIGSLFVLILTSGLIRLGLPGSLNQLILGVILVAATLFNAKWIKNRGKVLAKVYVSPTYLGLPERTAAPERFAMNDRLGAAEPIGLGEVEGPEDVVLDGQDNLYTGTRHGTIVKFFAPDYRRSEVFARIGGHPLGLVFAPDGDLYTCVGGMGVYKVSPNGEVARVTDETNRSWFSIIDDSRLRLPDDLDIAPDGRIFFSEATIRYEMSEWAVDGLEGRGNGRLICHDPKTGRTRTVLRGLKFPNGIAMCRDGQSLLFAETWACRINRYWFDGPKAGVREVFIDGLPGYPDNLNRGSDGTFWIALLGMRTKTFDLAMRKPGFRRRVAKRLAPDEWLFPNINRGCVVRVSEQGEILDVLWDRRGEKHASITSTCEHKGWLYLGGVSNNRVGRVRIDGADPTWTTAHDDGGRR